MLKIDSKIAEFVGMHCGDGTLYKTERSLVWELRGALSEREYYIEHVAPLLNSIFRIEFTSKFRSGGKNGCFGIQTSKKEVTRSLLNLGFTPERKTHTIRIPDYIKNSKEDIKYSFIRGLFDTDGCLRFDKLKNKEKKTYPKIEFGFASRCLRDDLYELLKELGFRVHMWGKKYHKLCLAGKGNLHKFLKEVKPQNAKHLKRYKLWLGKGYYNAEVA